MKTLIKIWSCFGYPSYFIGWIGSMVFFNIDFVSCIGIGIVTVVFHYVVLQILYRVNTGGWIEDYWLFDLTAND